MSRSALSWTDRKAPIGTFWDEAKGTYRAQIPLNNGKRFRGSLATADETAAHAAMVALCARLCDAGVLNLESTIATFYLGQDAEIIPIPLPPHAPPPPPAKARRSPTPPGWHGMDVMSIEVDHRLIHELTPDGSAAKIGVAAGTAAARAGLRTGDYILTIGPHGSNVPLREFDRLQLPAYAQVIVRFHRPDYHRAGEIELKLLKLGRPRERQRPPWWTHLPRGACGREVLPGKDRAAFAGQMAGHPHMPKVAHQILTLLLSYYGGPAGAFPSYGTLARDVGCRRRQTAIENVRALAWLGLLEVRKRQGRALSCAADRRGGGATNLFVLHWPEGWQMRGAKKSSGAPPRTT